MLLSQPAGATNIIENIIAATDEAGYYGIYSSLDADTIVVGAPDYPTPGSWAGGAYIYGRNVGGADNWGQVKVLTPDSATLVYGDSYGQAVSVHGDTILVGAISWQGGIIGAGYIHSRNQGGVDNWGEVAKLVPSDGAAGDFAGYTTAVHGDCRFAFSQFSSGSDLCL